MTTEETARPVLGKRARQRQAIESEILRVAREHLATEGAAALSLRAIARDLGMVSSGIYRYVESRDELLTRLIVDAYTSLAETVHDAHDQVEPADLTGRWDAIGNGLRSWAIAHPHDFALLYGSPVPDYTAPADRTTQAGTAVLVVLLRLLDDVDRAGRLASPPAGLEESLATAALGPMLSDDFFAGTGIDATALAQGLAAWTLLLGAVTSEVFEQLGPLPDAEGLFACLLVSASGLFIDAD
ncbi:TetR family transcriptional regulator [Intrasporangium oryzae NRRL B-24470]|uniref:TetR family transcriptional regulator n=1 Tax=Intrasporangium oryzae NRRL B-24470 TaxID=1386089 RepID=W9G4J5_9MICO|nr:TetR/AcrR family transcriptional regulator [Intrasporangium oryzae]EWT01036.1 TetR family transcriptional regulator [Intrasporangium oryzae NRRL B-24470]